MVVIWKVVKSGRVCAGNPIYYLSNGRFRIECVEFMK